MTIAGWGQRVARHLYLHVVFVMAAGVGLLWQPALNADTAPTLSIGVVIDTHPQQGSVIEFERQVVDSLRNTLAGTASEVFVITYSDRTHVLSDWSPVASGLKDAASRLAVDVGAVKERGAVLNDGLMDGLIKLGSPSDGHRKGLIVIGEGNDDGSTAQFSQVLRTAKGTHVQCFALLVANHRAWVGRVRQFGFDLQRLASGTRGKLYDVRTNPKLLDEALKDVQRRLLTAG